MTRRRRYLLFKEGKRNLRSIVVDIVPGQGSDFGLILMGPLKTVYVTGDEKSKKEPLFIYCFLLLARISDLTSMPLGKRYICAFFFNRCVREE